MPLDITQIVEGLSVGGGIYTRENAEELVANGITHVIDAQGEFDDTPLFRGLPVSVLWAPLHDDYSIPDKLIIEQIADFAKGAIKNGNFVIHAHCAAGVRRGPLVIYMVIRLLGYSEEAAKTIIKEHRQIADFPKIYTDVVHEFINRQEEPGGSSIGIGKITRRDRGHTAPSQKSSSKRA